MTPFSKQLSQKLEIQWNQFEKDVQSRISGYHGLEHNGLSWCLEKGSPFRPAYFSLAEYHEKYYQRMISVFCRFFSTSLWKRVVWPHFVDNALALLERDYFQILRWDNDPRFKDTKSVFIQHLRYRSESVSSIVSEALISEFLDVIGYSIVIYYQLVVGHSDIFITHKKAQNQRCEILYEQLRQEVFQRSDSLSLLFFLSARANWIDSFEHGAASFLKIFPTEIDEIMNSDNLSSFIVPLLGYFNIRSISRFLNSGPTHILYELDNSGEIYFDFLLIEQLLKKGHRITLVAKEKECLNDITFSELTNMISTSPLLEWMAPYINLSLLTIIHSGSAMPGKSLFVVPESYRHAYQLSDIIILKGQGNFQNMPMGHYFRGQFIPFQYKKPMIIMMGIKSPLIYFSLKNMFKKKKKPRLDSIFVYYYDSKDSLTFPI